MKKLIIILSMIIPVLSIAQDNKKFVTAMEKQIAVLENGKTAEDYQQAANGFERIAGAETKEWLPLYYQAFANLLIGMQQTENTKKDEYFDKAQTLIEKADELAKDNSEIYAMKSWIVSMKISVDPMNRGRELGMESGMLTATAMKLDPENPRPYLLKGQGLMYTPEQFGGGKAKAIPVLEQAVEKYKNFKPSSSIMPHWGEERAKTVLAECKKAE